MGEEDEEGCLTTALRTFLPTWKTRVRAPLPALHLYGLRPIEIMGEGNEIRVEEGHKFKDHGNVRDKLDVLRAVIEAVEEPPDIAQSLARLEVRRPLARPLKDEQIYGPRTTAAAAACESGGSNINECQEAATSTSASTTPSPASSLMLRPFKAPPARSKAL